MKKVLLALSLAVAVFTSTAQTVSADYQVVPLPQTIGLQKGESFVLSAKTTISCASADPQLQRNAEFLRDYVREYTGINLTIVPKKGDIVLALNKKIKEKEGYVLQVSKKQVTISGQTPAGVFYGIQTLRKSLKPNVSEIHLPAVVITDAPRFGYRGMMLDCARHFFPVETVKQFIDMMAMHNMNTFHWHLTDDQGWRIEIKKYPKLTEIGSKRDMTVIGRNSGIYDSIPYGGYYTQEDAKEILRYATERYITVIPEIDMPGHMLGALAAYPEMGCTGGPYKVWRTWGISDEVLCLANERTYTFCQDVLREIMDIFPSKYIHIGGDETPTTSWKKCPRCQALAKSEGVDIEHLQGVFTNRIEKYVNAQGRRIIGWDELMTSPSLQQSATIMSWRGAKPGEQAAKKGHDVIMSPTDYAYFDYYQTKETDNKWSEPLLIGGNLPIEKTYSFEPVADPNDKEAASHILGVQANLWTEYIAYPSLMQYQVLPRMAALSEVQWMSPEKKNFEQFRERAKSVRSLYDLYRYTYSKRLWNK